MPEGEGKEGPRRLTKRTPYIAVLYAAPIFLLFVLLGKWEMGIGAGICSGLVILVVMIRWELRKHVWFWMAIAVGFLVQIPAVVLIPWNNRDLTGVSMLPFAALDYGAVYGLVKLAEMLMTKRDGTGSAT